MIDSQPSEGKTMYQKRKRPIHIIVTVAIITAGVAIMGALTSSKSGIEKVQTSIPVPMVRALEVTMGEQVIKIRGEGTVAPLREIELIPQVSGKIVSLSSSLVSGGSFARGEALLSIDPVDYDLAVTFAKAQVKDAESSLKIVQQEALVAREEWRSYYQDGTRLTEEPPPLVAKEPQLAAAQAKLDASRADLQKALLNRERTVLKAPFDSRVNKKFTDLGQYVTPGQNLATLFSTEAVEIALPMEDGDLFWFDVPGFTVEGSQGSPATVHGMVAGKDLTFPGKVVRAEGKIDAQTRMVRVVVRVDKPYATKPPLAVGLFVSVDITGRILPDASVIPRSALRQGNIVWVVDDKGTLHFREVKVARNQGEEVIIKSGLKAGERIVFSPLKAPADGMTVRVAMEGNRS